jgi:enamine deaminase RidA (YjgF/YER057c/UK114 family)
MEVHLTQTLRNPPAASSGHTVLLPEGWPRPRGYVNGILARGETIYLGGIIGWDTEGRFPDGFVGQVRQTLSNIVAVLQSGGAAPENVVRMTWYVVDMEEYRSSLAELGAVYREVMGRHYPAMALVEVKSLVEPDALVEIEATAVIPPK